MVWEVVSKQEEDEGYGKAETSCPRADSFEDEALRCSLNRLIVINGCCSYWWFVSSGARSNNTMRIESSRPAAISI